MNIDWSKAPEGATGAMIANFSEEESGIHPGFVEFIGFDGADGREVYKEGEDAWVFFAKPSAWNGEGLPPVGTACEYYWAADDSWRSGICVAHYDGRAVICDRDDEDCADRLDAHHLRPLRTPEQIAAEERESEVQNVINQVAQVAGAQSYSDEQVAIIERLARAGYRKQEQTK